MLAIDALSSASSTASEDRYERRAALTKVLEAAAVDDLRVASCLELALGRAGTVTAPAVDDDRLGLVRADLSHPRAKFVDRDVLRAGVRIRLVFVERADIEDERAARDLSPGRGRIFLRGRGGRGR